MAEYSTSIDIDAPPEIVYQHLVTADGLCAWLCEHANVRAEPGGRFAVDIKGALIRGEYLELDAPFRAVVSWGMAGTDDFPVGSSRVEFTIQPYARGTRVVVRHTDLPQTRVEGYARGWSSFLAELQRSTRR